MAQIRKARGQVVVYHSASQVGAQWQSQQYDQSLSVIASKSVDYPVGEHLKVAKELIKEAKKTSCVFLWFDASEQDIDLYKIEFPDGHLNPVYLAMHEAYDIVLNSKQIMINLRQAAEHTITQDHRLIQPQERPSLALSTLIEDLCVHFGLPRSSWERVYREWKSVEESDDATYIDAYLYDDTTSLDVTSETFKGFNVEISLKDLINQMKELWVTRLKQLYTETCGFIYLTDCLVSQILQSCDTEHKVYPYPEVQSYVDEQVRCAPHRGDQQLMSGQNGCDLSILTLNPFSLATGEAAQEPLQVLRFGGAETEVELFLLDSTPLQLHVQFGLDEQHEITLDPSQMDSVQFDEPMSLTTLFDESFVVLLRQNSSSVTAKAPS